MARKFRRRIHEVCSGRIYSTGSAGASECSPGLLRPGAALLVSAILCLFGCSARAEPAGELHVPNGFSITVVSDVPHARFIAFAPNGDLIVANLSQVFAVSKEGGRPRVLLDNISLPHGVAFRGDDLYVAGWSGVTRARYKDGAVSNPTVLFSDMPRGGDHNHRALAIAPDGGIFVSSGSDCNVCTEDDPRFATVLRYDADGSHGRIYARGLRNASGLAFDEAGKLWAVVNERDMLGDDVPPEPVIQLKDGADYGWPYCHAAEGRPEPNPEFSDPARCAHAEPAAMLLQAHSAPLQIVFYRGTQFPARYRGAMFVAYHGSWNRSQKTGYKVVAILFANGRPQHVEDFATGWLHADQSVTGRPVGLAIAPDGSLYISDDLTGALYKVSYKS